MAGSRFERPKEFEAFRTARPAQMNFDGSTFPFRKTSALVWLGVYRRKQIVTWPKYFDLYKPGIKHVRGAERTHQADYQKARLILDWFDTGTPLSKADFV